MTVGDNSDSQPVFKMTFAEGEPPAPTYPPAADGALAGPASATSPMSSLSSHTDEQLLENFPVAKLTKLDELISNPRYESMSMLSRDVEASLYLRGLGGLCVCFYILW